MNFLNTSELLHFCKNEEWYVPLVQQLLKDFNRANVSVDINEGTIPAELKSLVHEKVYFLTMEKFSDYLNLMYAIDIPEHQFKSINSSDIVEVAEEITFLILKRELQKVMLKSKYKE